MTTIAEIERRGAELKEQFDRGAISEDDFRTGMGALRFQDSQSRWWMLGAQSAKWYMFDGTRWIPSAPSDISVSLPLAQPEPTPPQPEFAPPIFEFAPQNAEPALEEKHPTPISESSPESVNAGAPISAPPESVTTYIRRQRVRRSRASSLIFLGVGALALLLVIAALLFGIDNLMAGRPISSFLGNASAAQVAPPPPSSGLPANAIAFISVGDQAFTQGQIDGAIAQYQRAAQAAPSSAVPLTRLARAYAFKGQIQDAVTRARQAVKIAPNDAEAGAQLCRALTWDSQVAEGIKTCEAAMKADSKNVNAHAFLTEAYLHANRVSDAKAQATVALQLAPQSAEAHRAQAWVLTLSGQKDTAVAEWKQTQSLEPNLFYRHYEVGEVQRLFYNSSADAVPAYQKTLALYNAYLPAVIRLGLAFIDINQPQNAIPHLRRATTLSPNDAQVIAGLGVAYQKMKQCPQAIPYFEQALKLDANNSTAQRGLNECKTGQPSSPPPAPPPLTVPLIPPTVIPSQ